MNMYSITGFLFGIIIVYFGIKLSTDNMKAFVDFHAFFLVIGGTIASAAISIQLNKTALLVKVFLMRVIKGKRFDFKKLIIEIMMVGEKYRKGESFETLIKGIKDPFFKEALIMFNDGVLEPDDIMEVLEERVGNMFHQYTEDGNRFKNLGKYPPAFGLMGTNIGMIVLLGDLGGSDAIKKVGPAMSIAMVATLYGVILANLIIMPVGENLVESANEMNLKNKIIISGIQMVVAKTNPIIVAERLNSFLIPTERLDWKKVLGKA